MVGCEVGNRCLSVSNLFLSAGRLLEWVEILSSIVMCGGRAGAHAVGGWESEDDSLPRENCVFFVFQDRE